MNKVEKVSIGKCAFSLEEKAYAKAKEYLDSLELYYSKKEGGHEILEGIEERMAELLLEKTGGNPGVVSDSMIDEVIEILGKPEVIEEGSEVEGEAPRYHFEGKKKLYRDPTNKVIGGVCSGLAAYFNTDTMLFRLIFLLGTLIPAFTWVHFGGIFPVIYLIAWIVMPKADNLRKQCEMRGRSLNVNDIEQQYKEGSTLVADNDSGFWKIFGRICCIFIGVVLLAVGVTGLVAGGLVAFGSTAIFHFDAEFIREAMEDFFEGFGGSYYSFSAGIPTVTKLLLIIFCSLAVFLPFIGCIYGGINLIFNLKSPSWKPGLVIFILWLVAVVAWIVTMIIAAASAAAWGSGITVFIP